MTELNIERKERTAWPWLLLGALVVALLLWFLFGRADDPAEVGLADTAAAGELAVVAPAATVPATDGEMPQAVTDFLQFTEASPAVEATVAHDYTADGLRRLAAALGAVTANAEVGAVDVSQRVAEIRERADAMQQNPTSSEHAVQASEATLLAAALMRELPGATGGAEAYSAAQAIRGDRPLLEQTDAVRRFFEQSATVLRSLAATGG